MIPLHCPHCAAVSWLLSLVDGALFTCPFCLSDLVVVNGKLVEDVTTEPQGEKVSEQ